MGLPGGASNFIGERSRDVRLPGSLLDRGEDVALLDPILGQPLRLPIGRAEQRSLLVLGDPGAWRYSSSSVPGRNARAFRVLCHPSRAGGRATAFLGESSHPHSWPSPPRRGRRCRPSCRSGRGRRDAMESPQMAQVVAKLSPALSDAAVRVRNRRHHVPLHAAGRGV